MSRILSRRLIQPRPGWIAHWCDACQMLHELPTQHSNESCHWEWDGQTHRPTLSPSIRTECTQVCHYYLREGWLHYLNDSSHAYAGRVIALPDIPESVQASYR